MPDFSGGSAWDFSKSSDGDKNYAAVENSGSGGFSTVLDIESGNGTSQAYRVQGGWSYDRSSAGVSQLKVKKEKKSGLSVAEVAAEAAGDDNFPYRASTEVQGQYLIDNPDTARRIGKVWWTKLVKEYGDERVAAAAYNGGPTQANNLLKGRALHPQTAGYLKNFDSRRGNHKDTRVASVEVGGEPIDISKGKIRFIGNAKAHAQHEGLDQKVIAGAKALSVRLGTEIRITSGHRTAGYNKSVKGAKGSQHVHGKAIDIDLSGMSEAQRAALVVQTKKLGFTGIGVYGKNSNMLHIDMRANHAKWDWGKSKNSNGGPTPWFEAAYAKGMAAVKVGGVARVSYAGTGGVAETSSAYASKGVQAGGIELSTKYLLKNKRSQLRAEEKAAHQTAVAQFDESMQNAVAEIATTGGTSIVMPDNNALQDVLGSVATPEQVQELREDIMRQRQVASDTFNIRDMEPLEMAAYIEDRKPEKGSANYAEDLKAYEQLKKAGGSVMKSRQENGFAFSSQDPSVKAAEEGLRAAIESQDADAVADAQGKLARARNDAQKAGGVPPEKRQLVPPPLLDAIKQSWSDPEVSPNQKMIMIQQAFSLAGSDPAMSFAVKQQLKGSGVPSEVTAILDVQSRDPIAANALLSSVVMEKAEGGKSTDVSKSDRDEMAAMLNTEFHPTEGRGGAIYGTGGRNDTRTATNVGDARKLIEAQARTLMKGGMDLDDAMEQSMNMVLGPDGQQVQGSMWSGNITEKNGVTSPHSIQTNVVLPTGVDDGAFNSGLGNWYAQVGWPQVEERLDSIIDLQVNAVEADAKGVVKTRGEAYKRRVRNNLVWKNNGADKIAAFDAVNNRFLTDVNGELITVGIDVVTTYASPTPVSDASGATFDWLTEPAFDWDEDRTETWKGPAEADIADRNLTEERLGVAPKAVTETPQPTGGRTK